MKNYEVGMTITIRRLSGENAKAEITNKIVYMTEFDAENDMPICNVGYDVLLETGEYVFVREDLLELEYEDLVLAWLSRY